MTRTNASVRRDVIRRAQARRQIRRDIAAAQERRAEGHSVVCAGQYPQGDGCRCQWDAECEENRAAKLKTARVSGEEVDRD